MAATVSEIVDRLLVLVDEQGEGATPVLIEAPDGTLAEVGEIIPEDLAVVVRLAERPAPSLKGGGFAHATLDEFLDDMLQAAVAENPFVGDLGEETLAPAFVGFVRSLVRLTRAFVEVDGFDDGMEGIASSLFAAGVLMEAKRQEITVDEFVATLAAAPTAESDR